VNGAEIEQQGPSTRPNVDVARLDVEVKLALRVDEVERVQDRRKDRQQELGAQPSAMLLDVAAVRGAA